MQIHNTSGEKSFILVWIISVSFKNNPVEYFHKGQDTCSDEQTKQPPSAGEEVNQGHSSRFLIF